MCILPYIPVLCSLFWYMTRTLRFKWDISGLDVAEHRVMEYCRVNTCYNAALGNSKINYKFHFISTQLECAVWITHEERAKDDDEGKKTPDHLWILIAKRVRAFIRVFLSRVRQIVGRDNILIDSARRWEIFMNEFIDYGVTTSMCFY